ncbi:hypothetical protein DCAR_0208337 [Daucus carota subsp. sativus]|uniref:non-specific serine/threonine protein kinase n=1 Tax=Daucus carota subsp. sativus TaxID=79200 RepID=A0AAF1AQY2_DAUCS|nr:PREDICTED: putative receptor-like protein kinase At3g47110 isoform X1 [Daucus carota subsp. sativus]WOG89101.1 hypothetical protein DCAR_0208337 [Daucus carota subsp. sativus]
MELSLITLCLVLLLSFCVIFVPPLNLSISEYYASAARLGNYTDKDALLNFKSQITEDPLEVLHSWNDSFHFCQWTGIKCSAKHQRVISLDLKHQNLAGTLSPHVGNLSFLRLIDVAENSLHGVIPPELGFLARLQTLNLSNNMLEGGIPVNLSSCINLYNLALDRNFFEGNIPLLLGSLPKLVTLYIRNNNLTGRIPDSIGNLTSLQEFYASYNYLEGQLPNSLSQLRSLKMLGLSANFLSGEFPAVLYNLSSLVLVSLSFNNFTGTLRSSIGLDLPNLQLLYLANNYFTGLLPVSLTNASALERFDVPQNRFSGKVPSMFGNLQNLSWFNVGKNYLGGDKEHDLSFLSSLTNCSKLEFLAFDDNRFRGTFPNIIQNLSSTLTRLVVGTNDIRGSIPEEITDLFNLIILSIAETGLTGKLPASIGKLSSLGALHFYSNQFSGEIPHSLGNITQLLYLDMSNNSFEGNIPFSLGNCRYLQSLDLSLNKLNNTIPVNLFSVLSLSVLLNLSHNSLSGTLPKQVGNLTSLVAFDVSNNRVSGNIPTEIGNCLALEKLYIQSNFFHGSIPQLGNMKNIRYLDVSRNNLSGQIPKSMVQLSGLLNLNLSFNNLKGAVPSSGVFRNASAVHVLGNLNLCGGIQGLHLHPCLVHSQAKHRKHISLKLVAALASVVLFLALLLLFLLLCRGKKLKNELVPAAPDKIFYPKLSYQDLFNATGGFSSANVLGSGSYGTVYKGLLSPDMVTVAVKVLKLQYEGASKSFIAECNALRNLRHRHLVKVLNACSSINYEGNEFKAIVYQYMSNGSLEDYLHPKPRQLQQKNLSILQRINIALDVASALHYVHHQCQNPVVHCDLKPSNILLDTDLTAHVSDFGLARLIFKCSEVVDSNQFSSIAIRGTIGYTPPEYGLGSAVTTEGDVYSFGILLLEMFTGKRPTDEIFRDGMNLHNFVNKAIGDQVMAIVDESAWYREESVSKEKDDIGSKWTHEQTESLNSIFRIGIACSEEAPAQRMNMKQVAVHLKSIKEEFLSS